MLMNYKSVLFFLGILQGLVAQDPAPPAIYDFEKDEVYLTTRQMWMDQLEEKLTVAGLDSLTAWASLHKDWETVLDYAPQAFTRSPTAQRFYQWGGAAGFQSLAVARIFALPYVEKMKEGFKKAYALDPQNKFILTALIETYSVLPGLIGGNITYAQEKAAELAAIDPIEGAFAKGYIAEVEQQKSMAKLHYQKAFDLFKAQNSTREMYLEKARREWLYEMGSVAARFEMEYEVGSQLLHHYLALYSKKDTVPLAWVYYRLGQLSLLEANPQEALAYLEKAKKLNPKLEGLAATLKEAKP